MFLSFLLYTVTTHANRHYLPLAYRYSHFHLKTLCLSQSIPLPTWILDRTRLLTLKVLGIYDSYFYTSPSTLAVYENLVHATPTDDPLVIFGLGYYGSPGNSNITIFPALFVSRISIQKFDRILEALDDMGVKYSSFTDFHIYVTSTSGDEAEDMLQETFQFISQWFWQVLCISLRFSDPDIHMVSTHSADSGLSPHLFTENPTVPVQVNQGDFSPSCAHGTTRQLLGRGRSNGECYRGY